MSVRKVIYDNELLKMIQEMGYGIYIFFDHFLGISVFCEAFLLFNLLISSVILSCEMKLKLKVKLPRFFHSLNTCIYTRVVFAFFKSHFQFTQIILYKYCSLIFCKYSLILTVLTNFV